MNFHKEFLQQNYRIIVLSLDLVFSVETPTVRKMIMLCIDGTENSLTFDMNQSCLFFVIPKVQVSKITKGMFKSDYRGNIDVIAQIIT